MNRAGRGRDKKWWAPCACFEAMQIKALCGQIFCLARLFNGVFKILERHQVLPARHLLGGGGPLASEEDPTLRALPNRTYLRWDANGGVSFAE